MPAPAQENRTTAGISTSSSGTRVIPSSTRADGSTRKEIRVRPGYRPPEDVEVYKNRTAEAWKNRGKGGVPGAEGLKENTSTDAKSGAAAKNAKRREARKRAKEAEDTPSKDNGVEEHGIGQGVEDGTDVAQPTTVGASPGHALDTNPGTEEEKTLAEREKKAKRLKKKLREARELQAKKDKGEGLLQEQFDKVIKIKELMRELEKLGVSDDDASGERLDIAEASKSQ